MYRAMKNLNIPLPNAPPTGTKMPAVYPLSPNHHRSAEDNLDAVSILGEIPPPPPPVQSHAVLESGLGHELPVARTPGLHRKLDWPKPPNIPLPLPPLPPKRTSSRLSDMGRPANLNLSHDSSDTSIYSRPKPFHRSSLMSTGSSDSSGSSLPSEPELPLSPLTPSSAEMAFNWPHYTVDHRSVSQNEQDNSDTSINTSMTSQSGVYVKMHPVFSPGPDSQYMNLLYSAVQQQGGQGSLESALSPYLAMTNAAAVSPYLPMTGFNNKPAPVIESTAIDYSAIYAQIDSSKGSLETLHQMSPTSPPSSSSPTKKRSNSTKAKALAEHRELMMELERKRNLRVGLNLFNTNPDLGLDYMVKQGFLELSPLAVAKFLYTNTEVARAKVGEYLGQIQSAFAMKVLSCYLENFELANLRVDKALRKFLKAVQVPGEPQKIEKIMEAFGKRYLKCNPAFAGKLKSSESVVTLAFAVILLNTDLHTPNLRQDKKMLEKDFIANLKGADGGQDFSSKLLKSIYKGIKKQGFECAADHVTDTQRIRASMTGSKTVALEAHHHRRLVCLCLLSEVADAATKKESEAHAHGRVIWLFNDLLVVTKLVRGGGNNKEPAYQYKDAFHLANLEIIFFHTAVYKYGIQLVRKGDGKELAAFNAASEQDRHKFGMDLLESILEVNLMNGALRDANIIK